MPYLPSTGLKAGIDVMANLIRGRKREPGALSRLDLPRDPFETMRSFFRDPFGELESVLSLGRPYNPNVELKETGEAYQLKVDLPGVSEENVDVSVIGNRITISGKREEEEMHEGEHFHTYEREYGTFSRSFTLPSDANGESVNAKLENGVLSVTVPKVPEVRSMRVPIQSSKSGEKAALKEGGSEMKEGGKEGKKEEKKAA